MKSKSPLKPGQATGEWSGVKAAAHSLKVKAILVPIDFSDCSVGALAYAALFAEKFQATLILLHVIEPRMYQENYLGILPALSDVNQDLIAAASERLQRVGRKRAGHHGAVETLVRIGHAAVEISDTAKALGANLIIMGTHGGSGLKHVLLGSTTERVIHQAACPVLTVRHTSEGATD